MSEGTCIGGPWHGKRYVAAVGALSVHVWTLAPGRTQWRGEDDPGPQRPAPTLLVYVLVDGGYWRLNGLSDTEYLRLKAEVDAGQLTYVWKPER